MITTKLKIRIYGDRCLRKKSFPVKIVGPGERLLIASMVQTMHESKGVGLAAPQLGINEQIIVVDIGEGPVALINPRILKKRGAEIMEEGCLSIPGVSVQVKRPKKIVVRYLDENNKPVRREYQDLLARVIMHETDHFHGRLITDYASWREKLQFRKQLKALRAQSKNFKES